MSIEASGTAGGLLTFSTWKGRTYVRRTTTGENPKTAEQVGLRTFFAFLSKAWAALTPIQQATWSETATEKNILTFNAFLGRNMERVRQGYAPTRVWPPPPPGAPYDTAITPVGAQRSCKLIVGWFTQYPCWAYVIYRSLESMSAPDWRDAKIIVPAQASPTQTLIDSPLSAETYYYRANRIGFDARFTAISGQTHGHVT